jgi:hypothetical protein
MVTDESDISSTGLTGFSVLLPVVQAAAISAIAMDRERIRFITNNSRFKIQDSRFKIQNLPSTTRCSHSVASSLRSVRRARLRLGSPFGRELVTLRLGLRLGSPFGRELNRLSPVSVQIFK